MEFGMSNLVKFSGANLPSVVSLSTALRTIANDVSASTTAIIKMDRTGHWVFGADQTEAEEDSRWAVNPFSFVHGFIAWGDGEVLAEKLVSVTEPLPELEPAPPGAKKGWEPQTGLSLKCISGEDSGMEARFTTTSVGGRKAVQALAVAVATQVDKDKEKPVAIIKLGKDHYTHKSYGRIFTPVFEVVEWVSMDGEKDASAEAQADAAPSQSTGRRRRVA
jgi:hypothetical protein